MVTAPTETWRERLRRHHIDAGQGHGEDVAGLFERLDLSDLDMMTIRDLVQLGPDRADACLIALLGLMFAVLEEGSLCLELNQERLPRSFSVKLDTGQVALVDGFIRRLDAGRYDGLIDRSGNDPSLPLVLDGSTGRRLLYFQKFHHHERQLKDRLAAFSNVARNRRVTADRIRDVIDGLYREAAVIRAGMAGTPIVRDPHQVDAIQAAMTSPLLVVSGGPGTGKTSLLVNMLRALVRTGTNPSDILLAAPTGRAAQRMSEALMASLASITKPDDGDRRLEQLRGSTLHRLLAYRGRTGGFAYHRLRPIRAKVIAVDEVSMVDVVMMDRLFQAVDPERTRVILIGDKDQLPSVEAGSVLADMRPMAGSRIDANFVELRHVYRSAGKLRELAQAINSGQAFALTAMDFGNALAIPSGEWAFLEADEGGLADRHLEGWIKHYYLTSQSTQHASYVDGIHELRRESHSSRVENPANRSRLLDALFDAAQRCRILTVVRRGKFGAQWINDRIAAGLRAHLDPRSNPDSGLFSGALIMVTRNDYARGLFNGDVGVVVRYPDDGLYQAVFRRSGGYVAFPVSGLPNWELAFAMTVHKSQGSEFENTLLVLPADPHHRLLTREIVYTAATRASQRLIIYGSKQVLQRSLERKIQRQSGLVY
jgi:exodeoxyribonuclease V alpha subunit